jgi:N-acetyl sugar amidotransferase
MTTETYKICSRCVMDSSTGDLQIRPDGTCNYCNEFLPVARGLIERGDAARERQLAAFVARVKASGRGKRYDCVVGVSGGVDSSWALVQAVKLGLRPLAAHMDNGWNAELAQNNIANLVRGLGVDLHTHVIDWAEYRELMQAFFDSDVIDVELLYDNAMLAVNFQQAARYNVNYILTGSNLATEGMRIPESWNWFKYDKRNIKAIARHFGRVRIKTFPAIGTFGRMWHEAIRRRRWIAFLNYLPYNKAEALVVLQRDYGYKPYLYKHYESVFTRFYQGYILPAKFGVDKRRFHLSALIMSKQMTRDDALQALCGIPYASERALAEDKEYFLKKMGWTREQLDDYIHRPPQPHTNYASEKRLYYSLSGVYSRAFKKGPA